MRGKSSRGTAMSQKMRQIKAANPGMPQTQVLTSASQIIIWLRTGWAMNGSPSSIEWIGWSNFT